MQGVASLLPHNLVARQHGLVTASPRENEMLVQCLQTETRSNSQCLKAQ